ncbi:MAG: hypothetical protein ACRDBG_14035 [Waterburya sp.]
MRVLNDINSIADRHQEVTHNQSTLVLNLLKRVECPIRLAQLLNSVHPLLWDSWTPEASELLLTKANLH